MFDSIRQFIYINAIPIMVFGVIILATCMGVILLCEMKDWNRGRNLFGFFFGYTALLLIIGFAIEPDPEQSLPKETIQVEKVSHVHGTDNYIVQGKNGKIYNLGKNQVTTRTAAHRSTAKLVMYAKPKVGTSQRKFYERAKKNSDISKPELTMSLSAKDGNKHATVWNFN